MQIRKKRIGLVDWTVLAGIALLIAAEAAAVLAGLGPIFGVVALGYALVLAVIYWLYRSVAPSEARAETRPAIESRALKEVDIFKDLSNAQIERIVSLGERIRVPAGYALGKAGDVGNSMFVILDGKAQLSAHSAIGDITVRIAGPGESFPLAALIGSGTLITSAAAMTDMELLIIPRLRLLALCADDTEIGMRIYASVAEALGSRYSRTLGHLTNSAERALQDAGFFANV